MAHTLSQMARRHGLLVFVMVCVVLMLLASRGLRDAVVRMGGGGDEFSSAGGGEGGATTCLGKLARIGIDLGER